MMLMVTQIDDRHDDGHGDGDESHDDEDVDDGEDDMMTMAMIVICLHGARRVYREWHPCRISGTRRNHSRPFSIKLGPYGVCLVIVGPSVHDFCADTCFCVFPTSCMLRLAWCIIFLRTHAETCWVWGLGIRIKAADQGLLFVVFV